MKDKLMTHRVVTFLTREELDFLDNLEKDMIFSTGRHLSRSQIIQDMADILTKTKMDASGIKDDEELKARIMQAIVELVQKQESENKGKI
jgi:parvulin-like peptidyl-prolyl isomerase